MDIIDIILAVLLALATIRLTYLGVQVNPKEKVVFFVIAAAILILIGWQAFRSSQTQDEMQKQISKIEQNTKQAPVVQVTPQINIPPAQIIIPPQLEKSINDLRTKIERPQSDKQQKAAIIKTLCFNEKLDFTERPAIPPSPYNGDRGYATQIEVRPLFGSSQTVIIRINADAVFQLYEEESPEVVATSANGHLPNGRYYHELKLRQGAIDNSPTTFTLLSNSKFNVICIDRIPWS